MAGKQGNVMLMMVTLGAIVGICSAASFTVGDNTGWTIPPSPSFYSTWASKKTFKVGDTLVFNFPAGVHTVEEVSKASYDSCTTTNPLSALKTASPATYTLSSAGTHYYICTIIGHCSAGQKLSITVTGASSSPSPTTAPSPRKTPTPAPAPAPTRTITPPSSAPTPTPSAATPTPSPTSTPTHPPAPQPSSSSPPSVAPTPSPSTTAAPPTPSVPSPSGEPTSPSTPTADEPTSSSPPSSPPSGNFAAPTAAGVGFFGLLSLAASLFLF